MIALIVKHEEIQEIRNAASLNYEKKVEYLFFVDFLWRKIPKKKVFLL